MKNTTKSIIAISIFGIFNQLNSQTPFTKYFCEVDTLFNNSEKISSKSLAKNSLWASNNKLKNNTSASGKINGIAINRTSNFSNYTGGSNLKTFTTAHIYTTHNFDSAGKISTKFGKTEVGFNIGQPANVTAFNFIPFGTEINPQPIQINGIVLGSLSFQTSNSRGNLFAAEQYFKSNKELKGKMVDTLTSSLTPEIFPNKYPSDKTDYKNLLVSLNSAEYTGWIIEMDRSTNSFQRRRFDLGRSPRKSMIVQSNRTATSGSNATANLTYQILGENEVNILIKTVLNKNIQEFYVYTEEENTTGDHWSLINKIQGGSLQPLEKNILKNLFESIISNTELEFTSFLNITDIKLNTNTNSLILCSPGGYVDLTNFKNKYGKANDVVLATNLLAKQSGSIVNDKLGIIYEIDGEGMLIAFNQGFNTTQGKFVSNIDNVSITNITYIDQNSDPQNTSYLIFSENVFDNSLGQNPKHKTTTSSYQNEHFLVNLNTLKDNADVIEFKNQNFESYMIQSSTSSSILGTYSEAFMPLFYIDQNSNSGIDSLSFVRGFAEYFIQPELCDNNISIEPIGKENQTILVYPNPVNCNLTECLLHVNIQDDMILYTTEGKALREFKNTNQIELDGINAGIYFIKGSKGWSEIIVVQ